MATPYEFVVNHLRTHLPSARIEPAIDPDERRRHDLLAHVYHSGINGRFGDDFTTFNLKYPGGYPFYYPLQLSFPGQRPLAVSIAPGFDYLQRFTRPDTDSRALLAHYGYWRIETSVDPATDDFWILMLCLPTGGSQYLVLPTPQLKQMLGRTHNPEKFSLFLAKAGFCFAAQPLAAANRLAVLQNPSLLDGAENSDLKMDYFLNNWSQLCG